MLWIGGAQGAGKSTLAWDLSRTWDLPLHPVDLWAYDHQARLPPGQSLDEELAALALRAAPRLHEGSALATQRRRENAAAVRQGRLWARAAGLSTPPAYPFACECGTSRCRATWLATPDQYAARAASQPIDLRDGGKGR